MRESLPFIVPARVCLCVRVCSSSPPLSLRLAVESDVCASKGVFFHFSGKKKTQTPASPPPPQHSSPSGNHPPKDIRDRRIPQRAGLLFNKKESKQEKKDTSEEAHNSERARAGRRPSLNKSQALPSSFFGVVFPLMLCSTHVRTCLFV